MFFVVVLDRMGVTGIIQRSFRVPSILSPKDGGPRGVPQNAGPWSARRM